MRFDVNAYFGHWPYWDLHDKSSDDLITLMDRSGIDQAAVLSLRGMILDWRAGNAETLFAAARYPDRLVPVATISPFMGGNGDELRRLAEAGMKGVRLYPAFHSYRFDDPFVDDICRAAAERHLPVMIPTRPMMNWRWFQALGLQEIGGVIDRNPETSFIISGPNYLTEYQALLRVMQRCRNVQYEISCLQGFEAVRLLAAEVGAHRLLFGTGAVLNYPACNVAKLNHAEISDRDRALIAATNALRLLGFSE